MSAYRGRLEAAGIDLGPWRDTAKTAALGGWILAWAHAITTVLEEDRQRGTTTCGSGC
jgi:hypothetical protein